jgi:hypothetical protein
VWATTSSLLAGRGISTRSVEPSKGLVVVAALLVVVVEAPADVVDVVDEGAALVVLVAGRRVRRVRGAGGGRLGAGVVLVVAAPSGEEPEHETGARQPAGP